MMQTKLSGKLKVSQLIESLLRMQQLLFPVIGTHLSLIHNFRDRNGSKEKRAVKWLLSNLLKELGLRKSRWQSQMVMSSWLKPLVKTLMLFSILFFLDNSSRKVKTSLLSLDLKMLKCPKILNSTFRLSSSTHITNQKQLPSAQSLTSLSQKAVSKINYWQWLSKLKNQTSNRLKRS